MIPAETIRGLALFLPILIAVNLWLWRKPNYRQAGALLLTFLWNLFSILILHFYSIKFNFWSFQAVGGLFFGMPVDLYLAWALVWGVIPALIFPRLNLLSVILIVFSFDFFYMPTLSPVLVLQGNWLQAELFGMFFCLAPALLLYRWTANNTDLYLRCILLVLLFAGVMLFLLPITVVFLSNGDFYAFFKTPLLLKLFCFGVIGLASLTGLSAVWEFARSGKGSPLPFDPPKNLVTTGPYKYVANPMQISFTITCFALGVLFQNIWLAAIGVMAVIYSEGIARWDEDNKLIDRFGDTWINYQRNTRRWFPRITISK